ncbi:cell division protein MraZ [Mycoplasmopsis bovigenitalium]|uniref:Transcriptional regulator MraZ n=1 Tax=Mycoplasmopsis bovigenitalium TaxID=2112 RepID=A0A449A981_9BACT|nr:division/cell wall cluster transcriptional repressor MraZ [Mycoplasmopsis bovigenitalium]VEU60839.1 cell division protein MraZ [Mycoplasmopsis bovigenitalium]
MYGQYDRTIDSKNRVALPAKLRDALGSKFYLTIGMQNIVELRSEAEFAKLTADLTSKSAFDKNANLLKRFWLGNTHEIELDSLARFVLPKNVITKAAIQKDVIFIGVGNSVELWSAENFEKYNEQMSVEELENAANELAKYAR